jgi:hypothetical protein
MVLWQGPKRRKASAGDARNQETKQPTTTT